MLSIVKNLINLTNTDQILWERPLLNINRSESNGWSFYLELLQDDKPHLEIHSPDGRDVSLDGYGYGIQDLYQTIILQYRRQQLYQFSKEHERQMIELEEVKLEKERETAKKIEDMSKEFKEALKNPRTR